MRILLLLLTLLSTISFAEDSEQLPVEYFTKFDDYRSVTISPDGKHFAVRAINDGKIALIFIRREDMAVVGGTKGPNEGQITSVQWVNNERVVYTSAYDNGYLDANVTAGHLYAVNVDGSDNQTIFAPRYTGYRIISLLPEEEDYILLATFPPVNGWSQSSRDLGRHTEIVKLDINWGRSRKLYRMPLRNSLPIADDQGHVLFTVATTINDETRVFSRASDDDEWVEQAIHERTSDKVRPLSLSSDGRYAVLWDEEGADGMGVLYRYDLKTKDLQVLHESKEVTLNQWFSDSKTKLPIIGLSAPDDYIYHYFDPEHPLAGLHQSLRNAFKEQFISFHSSTEDDRLIVVYVSSDQNPGEYYLFDAQTKKAKFLMARRSWIDKQRLRPVQNIELTARDGQKLRGYLTLPADEKKPYPLVVLPHGGPFGIRDYRDFNGEVQLLAHNGYAVLQVNFRGSGGYGTAFEKAGHRQWGQAMQDDLTDATQWLVEQGYADKNRMCIFGASYGGYAALMGVIREPDLYRCAIGYAGVYDLNMMYEEGGLRYYSDGVTYLERTLGEDSPELKAYSPVHQVDKIKVPLFIAHGGEDRVVPDEHAKALRDALKDANKEFEWLHYRREVHGFANQEHLQAFYSKVLAFLDEHIGES
jgi:dipeptidyl aminopeptidase/acylaminoacyl peptidase